MPKGEILLEFLSRITANSNKDIINMLSEKSLNNSWSNDFVRNYGDKLKGLSIAAFEDSYSYVVNKVFAQDGHVYIKDIDGEKLRLKTLLKNTIIKIPSD